MQVKSVTGATLQVKKVDLTGRQLAMGKGAYKDKLVTVVGIASQFRVANLVIKLESGQFMAINPDDLVGYDGNGKGADDDI